jgi:hypothetical protein
MQHHNTTVSRRIWRESGHASLCLLGVHPRRKGLFKPLEARVQIQQKVLTYTPVKKTGDVPGGITSGSESGQPYGHHGPH